MNSVPTARLRSILIGLILASGALFVVGVLLERADESTGHGAAAEASGESAEAQAAETAGEVAHSEGTVFGIGPDSPLLVIGAVLVSLALAAVVLRKAGGGAGLAAVAAVCIVFAAFDFREGAHQAEVERTGVLVIALVVGVGHLLAAGYAGLLSRRIK